MSDTIPSAFESHELSTGTISGIFALLLRNPEDVIGASDGGRLDVAARLFAGSLLCFGAYGAAVGMFGGGWQIVIAMLKVPLVIFATLLLCLPSFHVFTALAGSHFTLRRSFTLLLGFTGMLGLLLAAFLPVTWLFSASTKSELFLTWMNLLLWICAIGFAMRFLNLATSGAAGSARTIFFWSILFLLVSMQMTTHLRPILWEPGSAFFEANKLSFFGHLWTLK